MDLRTAYEMYEVEIFILIRVRTGGKHFIFYLLGEIIYLNSAQHGSF